ncbi:hypothetical protein, partial [Sulfitobacter sp.]|uniref:hypothetical protein n=1 Tax=Sulfitobacter sp. TaxID=1903071 RepID=UPI0030026D26
VHLKLAANWSNYWDHLYDCVACSIGHLKNEFSIARISVAKKTPAADVVNPPLTAEMTAALRSQGRAEQPPNDQYLLKDEGRMGGVVAWYVEDRRINCYRVISRRDLFNQLLEWNPPQVVLCE